MAHDLSQLIGELLADEGYASGRRRFPRTVTVDEAVGVASIIHDEVDRGVAAREVAAEVDGVAIACHRGCNHCCEEMVLVHEPEAQLIARWLREPENEDACAAFLEAYPRWREGAGDAPAELAALVERRDRAGYEAAHIRAFRRRVLCAFNREGDCIIYPVRPTNCRNAHAVDTAERCRADHQGRPATRLAYVPLDQFLSRARRLERATHHAIGGARGRPQALCDAVHRLLQTLP